LQDPILDIAQNFSFDWYILIPSILFGIIGMYVFKKGRRIDNRTQIIIGIILMIYPYFVSGLWQNWLVGFAFCGIAYLENKGF
jgi:hypothetical protein